MEPRLIEWTVILQILMFSFPWWIVIAIFAYRLRHQEKIIRKRLNTDLFDIFLEAHLSKIYRKQLVQSLKYNKVMKANAEPYRYFKLTESGNLKFIKTNNQNSEVVLYLSGTPKWMQFPDPYPIWDVEGKDSTKQEFEEAKKQAKAVA
jgi:hypothetical protein